MYIVGWKPTDKVSGLYNSSKIQKEQHTSSPFPTQNKGTLLCYLFLKIKQQSCDFHYKGKVRERWAGIHAGWWVSRCLTRDPCWLVGQSMFDQGSTLVGGSVDVWPGIHNTWVGGSVDVWPGIHNTWEAIHQHQAGNSRVIVLEWTASI